MERVPAQWAAGPEALNTPSLHHSITPLLLYSLPAPHAAGGVARTGISPARGQQPSAAALVEPLRRPEIHPPGGWIEDRQETLVSALDHDEVTEGEVGDVGPRRP